MQDWAAQQRLVERTRDAWGRLDVVFANAGVAAGAGFVRGDATPEEWRAMVLTNIFGVAATVMWALDQPPQVDINEVLIRPVGQLR